MTAEPQLKEPSPAGAPVRRGDVRPEGRRGREGQLTPIGHQGYDGPDEKRPSSGRGRAGPQRGGRMRRS